MPCLGVLVRGGLSISVLVVWVVFEFLLRRMRMGMGLEVLALVWLAAGFLLVLVFGLLVWLAAEFLFVFRWVVLF